MFLLRVNLAMMMMMMIWRLKGKICLWLMDRHHAN
jgi:hypothetical protein